MLRSLTILASFIFISFLSQENLSAQWVQTNGPYGRAVNSIIAKSDTVFASLRDGGVFYTTDDGVTWLSTSTDLRFAPTTLCASGNNLLAGGVDAMSISTNNGIHWSAINVGNKLSTVLSFAVDNNNVFVGTDSTGMFLSSDNGLSWSAISNGIPYTTHAIIAGTDTSYSGINGIAIHGDTILAISHDPRGNPTDILFQSTDYGTHWMADTNLPSTGGFGDAIAFFNNSFYVGTDYKEIFQSSNDGVNWITSNNDSLAGSYVSSFAYINGVIFAAIGGGGIFRSTDNGMNWIPINDGLTDLYIQVLCIKGSYLFAGTTTTGIWRRPLSDFGITAVKENPTASPAQFSLSQNYPNPFDAATTISYSLPEAGHVTLKVYNTVGEEVATLVNEENTAGSHSATFNALNAQNGIYFYTLTAGKYSQTGKMAVVK